jgi:hypothetical protein
MLFLLALIFGLQRFSAKTRENNTTEEQTTTFDIYFHSYFQTTTSLFQVEKIGVPQTFVMISLLTPIL